MSDPVQNPTLQVKHDQAPQQQLTQRMMMSAHMQQALRLLQLPLQELEVFIEEQIVLNPLLEWEESEEDFEDVDSIDREELEQEVLIDEGDLSILNRLEEDMRDRFDENENMSIKRNSEEEKFKNFQEQSIQMPIHLHDYLIQIARETFEHPEAMAIAEILIGYIDEGGFLTTPLNEICQLHQLKEGEVQKVLHEIQKFEPYGIGAASIQESFLIQLQCQNKEQSLAYRLISECYDQLLHNQLPQIQKLLKCSLETIQKTIDQEITKLDLHPGMHFASNSVQTIVPDVTLRLENELLIVEVEREFTSNLRINQRYYKMLMEPTASAEIKHFIKHHIFSAKWLMRNLQQRFSTLERIVQVLAVKQYPFFTEPNGQLLPLTMKTIAEELELHESTIARTVANKYLNSPRGLTPLRAFFTNKYVSDEGENLSSTTVKEAILDLIKGEDKNKPFSDEKISQLLKTKGINCARRTVAKYRGILTIGNTQQRKKFN